MMANVMMYKQLPYNYLLWNTLETKIVSEL